MEELAEGGVSEVDLKDQHRHHDHPHLHLSHPYLHSQVDQVGSGKDFKDAESSKL